MKKASEYITIIVFFLLLAMFAVSTVFFQKKVSFDDEKNKGGTFSETFDSYARDNFPLQNNWKSLYANTMVLLGKEQFGNIYILDDKLVETYSDVDTDKIKNNVSYLNDFAQKTDIPIYTMIVPTSAGIYSADLPSYANGTSQKNDINNIYLT